MGLKNQKLAVIVAMAVTGLAAACSGGSSRGSTVGPGGGTVTAAGVRVTVPVGALSTETQISIDDLKHDATGHKVHIGPDDASLAKPVAIAMFSDDGNAADEKMVGIDASNASSEIEVQIENEHELAAEHARELEVQHFGAFELRPARVCNPACGAGTHCDDGVCKPNA